jgi:hypothetical protein
MQPVDRSLGGALGHPLDLVIERSAVLAVEIAFKFSEQISIREWKFARGHPGTNVREEPATHRVVDFAGFQ